MRRIRLSESKYIFIQNTYERIVYVNGNQCIVNNYNKIIS